MCVCVLAHLRAMRCIGYSLSSHVSSSNGHEQTTKPTPTPTLPAIAAAGLLAACLPLSTTTTTTHHQSATAPECDATPPLRCRGCLLVLVRSPLLETRRQAASGHEQPTTPASRARQASRGAAQNLDGAVSIDRVPSQSTTRSTQSSAPCSSDQSNHTNRGERGPANSFGRGRSSSTRWVGSVSCVSAVPACPPCHPVPRATEAARARVVSWADRFGPCVPVCLSAYRACLSVCSDEQPPPSTLR